MVFNKKKKTATEHKSHTSSAHPTVQLVPDDGQAKTCGETRTSAPLGRLVCELEPNHPGAHANGPVIWRRSSGDGDH